MDLKYFWAMKSLGWVVSVRCARQPGAPLPLAKDETFVNIDIQLNTCYARTRTPLPPLPARAIRCQHHAEKLIEESLPSGLTLQVEPLMIKV